MLRARVHRFVDVIRNLTEIGSGIKSGVFMRETLGYKLKFDILVNILEFHDKKEQNPNQMLVNL